MSMTSVSVSCAIRRARSGGSSGGGIGCGGAAGRRGGVHATFGAGAVPATPWTPGVPQLASSTTIPAQNVPSRHVPYAGERRRRTSGWCVSIRLRIRLCAKGWRLDRCSPEYTHGRAGAWNLEEVRYGRCSTGAAGSLALGGALLQDASARRGRDRRRQGSRQRRAGQARQGGGRGRRVAHPARAVRVPRARTGPRGAPGPAGGRGRAVRRGSGGETAPGTARGAAPDGAGAAL